MKQYTPDQQRIHRALQAAVDHYPQLAVFHLELFADPTAVGSSEETLARFLAELKTQFDSCIAIAVPPTLVRMLWGEDEPGRITALMMLNQNTLIGKLQNSVDLTRLIAHAWSLTQSRTPEPECTSIFFGNPIFTSLNRHHHTFSAQFVALHQQVMQFPFPAHSICGTS
ncbi:hypothetical protein MUU47_22970 [Scandinavium sp. H11S7]|uniref:Uncharacterized protein n=1 Tax=Scandinavium hiltneri TaxID=2926519 RepID=A0ABT2E7S0_9ENTR|nr:hypothetical protein [Scandinavium hiltneri]MCS2163936.1 hypothetical protein [Scandinavium hiltneri]